MTKSYIQVTGAGVPGQQWILTPDALAFLTRLQDQFAGRRGANCAGRTRGAGPSRPAATSGSS